LKGTTVRNIRDKWPFAIVATFLIIIAMAAIGWIANIVKLFSMAVANDPNVVMAVLRGIGIFLFPLGVILGFL
jgi:uncharacterized membrane protein YadS